MRTPLDQDLDLKNAVWDYVHRDPEVPAERRHKELLAAHQAGWAGLTRAVTTGLKNIAEAVARRGDR